VGVAATNGHPYFFEDEQYGRYNHHEHSHSDWHQNRFEDVTTSAEPSGFWGGEAIIYAGVVTSVTGGKGVEYHQGMVEHVAWFDPKAVMLSKATYEGLSYDVPHIKPNGYKVVFMKDEGHYY
jgi:hypothetical protein